MKNFTPCRKCASKHSDRVPLGYIREGSREEGFKLVECECHKKWTKYRDIYLKAKDRGFNTRLLDCDQDYKGEKSLEVRNKLLNDWPTTNIVYIYGPNGTQKTTTAQYAAFNQIKKGKSCYFVLMSRLLDILMKASSFNPSEEIQKTLEKIKSSQIVFIDEAFDSEKMAIFKSGWKTPFLDTFLRECINDNIQLVFISNINPKDIDSAKFSFSIKDLVLRESGEHYLFEDSYRDQIEKWDGGNLFE